ncbi:MAG: hypothetical protein AVDCRST_MAG05-3219, partial [uncultured Rubrobacteraceae bacterium]
DHTKGSGAGGSGSRGTGGALRRLRAAALFGRGRAHPVRRLRRDAATGVALLREALARRGGRVPLRHLGRGDRGRGGRRPPAAPRRCGLLAGGRGERSPGCEPFGRTLLLPHLRNPDGARGHPLPRRGENRPHRGRGVAAAPHGRRVPDHGRKKRTGPSPLEAGFRGRPGAV